jgi:hypothetical protein
MRPTPRAPDPGKPSGQTVRAFAHTFGDSGPNPAKQRGRRRIQRLVALSAKPALSCRVEPVEVSCPCRYPAESVRGTQPAVG